jgi:hypothetical protein
VSFEPNLRIRREQPRLIGNILAMIACVIYAGIFIAWGFMQGPAPQPEAPGVDIVNTLPPCDHTTVPPDNC